MKRQTDKHKSSLASVMFLCIFVSSVRAEEAATTNKCNEAFTKVSSCLSFATGTASAPSKECCDAATEMRNSDPECMCYVIQQVRKGDQQVKSLGIQYAKLLQLPTACHLKNSSVSDCPKLLHIPPGSPDAAVFANSSTEAPATGAATGTSPAMPDKSNGLVVRPNVMNVPKAIIAFVFLLVLKNSGLIYC